MQVNGQQLESISLLDRGLQYGDGLFETISLIKGSIPFWDKHYARLRQGCERLGLTLPAEAQLHAEVLQEAGTEPHAVVKVLVTRGSKGRGYFPGEGETTRIVMRRAWTPLPAESYIQGIDVHLCTLRLARGSALAGIKHLNRLEQVLAAREVAAAGFTEGVLLDAEDDLVEGLMANLFWLKGNQLMTPSLDQCGVAGIMRAEVMALAASIGLSVRTVRAKVDALLQADACFLSNAVNGVVPVATIHNAPAQTAFSIHAIPVALRLHLNQKLGIHHA